MDIKDELENELALAILVEKRLNNRLDSETGRQLIKMVKNELELRPLTSNLNSDLPTAAETAYAH